MKRWRVIAEEDRSNDAGGFPGIPQRLVRSLIWRGVHTAGDLDRYLRPRLSDLSDPFLLPGMTDAVARIWRGIQQGESILIYGDYDVDGITSAALMVEVLSALGARVACYLPSRLEEGYGLGVQAVQRCIERYRPSLIITTDCGTGSVDAVGVARDVGVDVVVTDHHEVSGPVAPAVAIVNPKLGACAAGQDLAGVGVAFKVCHALLKAGRDQGLSAVSGVDLRAHLDLVALGTIADVVPLRGENRILTAHGLARLNRKDRKGIAILGEVAGGLGELGTYHVAFVLGPRLNAAGRLGTADAALELLLTREDERARVLSEVLESLNRDRKQIEKAIIEQIEAGNGGAFQPVTQPCIVVGGQGWHLGVIGVVASRLSTRYGRPTIVIGFDEKGVGRGSCRSVEGFDLLQGLKQCESLVRRYGGHAMAAGMEIQRGNLESFQEAFHRLCAGALQGKDLTPALCLEDWVALGEVQETEFLGVLERMAPFGEGNPEPVWGMRGVRVSGAPRMVGTGHLKMTIISGSRSCEAIGFHMASREVPQGAMDIAFTVRRNHFMGRSTVQLQLQDFRPSGV